MPLEGALTLQLLPGVFGICRLAPTAPLPLWATGGEFCSITITRDELSVVCPEADVPADQQCERDWMALKILGPLPFSLTGVVASVSTALAERQIGIFVISTYDTDYILVKRQQLAAATAALVAAGHIVLG